MRPFAPHTLLAVVLVALAVLALAVFAIWFASRFVGDRPVPCQGSPVPQMVSAPSGPVPEIATPTVETATRMDAATSVAPAPEIAKRAQLDVRVVARETKAPLAGVRVGLELASGTPLRDVDRSNGTVGEYVSSDASGRATFDVDPGVELRVSIRGADSVARNAPPANVAALAAGETRELVVELDLEPDLVFLGRVLERESRAPIAGAVVRREEVKASESDRVTTDADGTFRFALRTWRDFGLEVKAKGFGPRWVGSSAGHETAEKALEVLLERGATLRVEVLGPDRVPLAEAGVRFEGHISEMASGAETSSMFLSDTSWSATTQSNGVAAFTDLPPGVALRGTVRRGNKLIHTAADPLTLAPGEDRSITWSLGVGGEIRGVVREQNGTPVAQLEMWLQRATSDGPTILRSYDESGARRKVRTDANGSFRFADVAVGGWWVGPRATEIGGDPTTEPTPLGEHVEMTGGTIDLDVRLVRGLVIRGRIVAADGEKPASATVIGSSADGAMFVQTHREATTFVLGPLGPGRWKLSAISGGSGESDLVEAEAGATDVVLRMTASTTARVRVLDAAGTPVVGAALIVGTAKGVAMTQTDARGEFLFTGLRVGEAHAAASTKDGRWASRTGLQARAGERLDVDLVLEQGVVGRLRCVSAELGTSFRVVHDDGDVAFVHVTAGNAVDVTLPLGRSILRAEVPVVGTVDRAIDVAAGTAPEIVWDGGWR